jgi:hypothetical protein
MRAAHATLFFDLVLSSMLVVVVLLSMQRFSVQSDADSTGWTPSLFASIGLYASVGNRFLPPPDCEAGPVGRPVTVGDAQRSFVPGIPTPIQVPLEIGATSQVTCTTRTPMAFFVPSSSDVATAWICVPDPSGHVSLRIVHDPSESMLSYGCDGGIVRAAPYPIDLRRLAEAMMERRR